MGEANTRLLGKRRSEKNSMKIKDKIQQAIVSSFIALAFLVLTILGNINSWSIYVVTLFSVVLAFASERTLYKWQDVFDNINWKKSLRSLQRFGYLNSNAYVRISFAYLFRIMIDGKYLLILNDRKIGFFQPIGGVYKYYDEEAEYISKKFSFKCDDLVPCDADSNNDYRLYVRSKDLRRFVRRFNLTKFRESYSDLSRELKEELNIDHLQSFSTIKYSCCGRHMTNVQFSEYLDSYELLLADIINLQLSDEQRTEIRAILRDNPQKFILADADSIKRNGVKSYSDDLHATIASHTRKILQEYDTELQSLYCKPVEVQIDRK